MEKSLNEVDEPVRVAFAGWLSKFKPQEDAGEVMILSLGKVSDVHSQEPAPLTEMLESSDQ
jgi:hypothetical protein